jgi:DNA-binding PadR family transcriptional regulator
MLHAMETAGYLRCEPERVAGRTRKYYRITPSGTQVLERLKDSIRELTGEVLQGDGAP